MSDEELRLIFNMDPDQIPKQLRKPWLPHEDDRLVKKCKEIGENWNKIALNFGGHTQDDCRERFIKLNNEHVKGAWSEDETLIV